MSTATNLLTAEQYAELPDPHGYPTELVKGNLVVMVPPTPRHGQICSQVIFLLRQFLESYPLGHVLSNDSGIVTMREPDTVRGADIAFYSFDRVPPGPLPKGLLDVAPELVFEVRSPSERWSDIHVKSAEYLDAGVRTVGVLDDDSRSLHLFHADRPTQVLQSQEEFTLPEILGDFTVTVSRFFE